MKEKIMVYLKLSIFLLILISILYYFFKIENYYLRSIFIYLSFIVMGVLFSANNSFPNIKKNRISPLRIKNASYVALGVIIISSFIAYSMVYYLKGSSVNYFNFKPNYNLWDRIVFSLMVAPIIEEFLFRKSLIDLMIKSFNAKFTIIISAILFSIAHFNTDGNLLQIFLVGVILGFIYYVTKDIWIVIIIHSFINLGTLSLRYILDDLFDYLISVKFIIIPICIFFVIGCILLVSGLNYFRKISHS
ncbi:CPBP family intramembrane glutamic endopeptidase [Robertkochia solimangrovi]|uniref:CPBP family intramembrane glutamic endopeptidase n=1 Tax=Robertkochia solimangrovi TaxID=2213046 RepID=UPI00117C0438|nr:type II CAAX endopeptidase family protein [Robertkochia solimangrovi]TRZ42450.1 hypothetical protein DMZ48_13130 [Robertkochia solimangrovi]